MDFVKDASLSASLWGLREGHQQGTMCVQHAQLCALENVCKSFWCWDDLSSGTSRRWKGETCCLEMSPGISVWLIYTQMWFIITIYDHCSAGLSLSQQLSKLFALPAPVHSKRMQIWQFLKSCVQMPVCPQWLEVSLSPQKRVIVKEMKLGIMAKFKTKDDSRYI